MNLGEVRIRAKILQPPRAPRTKGRRHRDHQGCYRDEASLVAYSVRVKNVALCNSIATQVLPPQLVPQRRGERGARGDSGFDLLPVRLELIECIHGRHFFELQAHGTRSLDELPAALYESTRSPRADK